MVEKLGRHCMGMVNYVGIATGTAGGCGSKQEASVVSTMLLPSWSGQRVGTKMDPRSISYRPNVPYFFETAQVRKEERTEDTFLV